jgi:hypothetical protein
MYVPYQVHKTIINNLSLNYDGDLLATASEKVNQLMIVLCSNREH